MPGAAATVSAGTTRVTSLRELMQVYKQLSKAKLSLLVVSTAAAGYVLGSGETVDWKGMAWCSLGTFCAASCANTLNQVYEVANDARMKRTRNRPLPLGKISKLHALGFAAAMGITGTAVLLHTANPLTGALGVTNIALYAGVYTPLKVVSSANTFVGAVVGAIPPLMGWAAASGGLDAGAAVLAAGLYFWQIPHFLALAWLCREDYARGGYRMLSLIDATGRRTAAAAFRNCVYMFPLGMVAVALGVATYSFAYHSALITGALAATSIAFYQSPTNGNARVLFRASLLHLPLFMAALVVCRVPQGGHVTQEQGQSQMWARLQGVAAWPQPLTRGGSAAAAAVAAGGEAVPVGCPVLPLRVMSIAPFPLLPVPSFAAGGVPQPGTQQQAAIARRDTES